MMVLAVVNEGIAQQPEGTERKICFHSDDQTENLVRYGQRPGKRTHVVY